MSFMVNLKRSDALELSKKICDVIENFCDRFSLVSRDELQVSVNETLFLKRIEPYLISAERRTEWPGTTLLEGSATVRTYRLNKDSLEIIRQIGGLFKFMAPNYPEDICFYRSAKPNNPWLVTISHEEDLYLLLEPSELEFLKSYFGKLEFVVS